MAAQGSLGPQDFDQETEMPKTTQHDLGTGGIQAVSLALRILELLAFSSKPGRITDISEALGTSKTRVFNHLKTLVGLGYVVQDRETERYRVAIQLVELGTAAANQFGLITVSRPIMQRVRDQIGSTVVLSRIDFDKVFTIEQIDGRSMLRLGLMIGSPLGLHSSAQGKLVLAFGRSDLLDQVIAAGLAPRTKGTITDPKRLRREVMAIRKQSWAVAPNETMTGLNALAAPIFEGGHRLIGTLAVLASVDEMPSPPGDERITIITNAAREISASLAQSS
jgi:IclR family transcriptional regulator, KDG regulon repressor